MIGYKYKFKNPTYVTGGTIKKKSFEWNHACVGFRCRFKCYEVKISFKLKIWVVGL